MAYCWRCKRVWMTNILLLLALSVAVCEGCLNVEREALLKIKDDINYPNGYSLSNWEGHDCCQWSEITCDNSTGRVIEIDLYHRREAQLGTWYPNASLFAQLEELSYLEMSWNQIGGWSMPQGLCKLVTLIHLDLSYNNFDDDKVATCLGNLTKLQSLLLSGNKFSGKFLTSTGLCKLVTLIELDLSYNNLDDDKVSTCLGNLTKLQGLSLRGNKLSGKFFTSTGLRTLTQLKLLDLSGNVLENDQFYLHGLTMLEYLFLGGNRLQGNFITMSGLCKLVTLIELDLSDNNFDDDKVATCLGNLTKLQSLDLSRNKFSGKFLTSTALRKLTQLRYLDLSQNVLENDQFYLHGLTMLEYLRLNDNRLQGNFITMSGLCKLVTLTYLDLSDNNFDDDKVATCLGNLTKLQWLYLSGNKFSGKFLTSTGICESTALQTLDLSNNRLDDPNISICLANLTKLQVLNIAGNDIRGNFFSSGLCKLVALEDLDLSDNNFDDHKLPTCLGNLTKLQELDLSGNNLSDNLLNSTGLCELRELSYLFLDSNALSIIPPCIGNMDSLQWLSLSHNLLSGSIPPSVTNTRSLQVLDLSDNYLNGSILWLGNLSSLSNINLEYNNFDGVLEFSTLANLSNLYSVCFSNNPHLQLETESPTWIPSFQLYTLHLSNCQLNTRSGGSVPSFITNQSQLEDLDLSRNNLRGYIPSWLMFTLTYLNMSGNAFQGITTFQSHNNEASHLKVLDLSSNEFSGELPMELFEKGVLLEYLSLSSNHLQFDNAPSFSNMTSLEVLLLDKNAFTEIKIFQGLANISSLQVLDIRENFLTGTLPSWLSGLSNLASLLLGGNKFDGHIHAELCQMQRLRLLDFSYNDLSGDIPHCFNNISAWVNRNTTGASTYNAFDYKLRTTFTTKGMELTYEGTPLLLMIGIDFSSNKLMGKIPLEIGYLKEIKSLNLSHNLLTGDIPKTFQHLKNIESLDLSNNKLTGHIPMELTQLYSLSAFNVAFNNLSGVIPYSSTGQFSTFNESIYDGNQDLCGRPLKRNCSPSPPAKPSVEQSKENDESTVADNPLFFYSCVVIGYALGFWGCIALLYICKSWRMKLFSVVDRFF